MIRDPSDGTVREKPMAGESPVIDAGTSGLATDKLKTDELARLQRSRDWLSKYRVDPESVTRRMGEQGSDE